MDPTTIDPAEFAKLQAELDEQREVVKQLKDSKASKEDLAPAVAKLKELKSKVDAINEAAEALMAGSDASKNDFNREGLENLLQRRFFVVQGFELYGGVAGLYDFGPPGSALKSNLIQLWRNHFIIHENMLELDLSCLTPEEVLKTSGHVERFNDIMVRDEKTGDCHRADKLLEVVLEKLARDPRVPEEKRKECELIRNRVDALTEEEMDSFIEEFDVRSPDTGNKLTKSFPFNLMFSTSIGPTGTLKGYLRPETAQGIFVNFRRMLEFNGGRMPFAGATIGQAFRNEIAPRAGLLRVREFTLAEIEHFVHPEDKSHPRFYTVKDLSVRLFPREEQERVGGGIVEMTVGDAVAKGIIANETVGYFLGRAHIFLQKCGANPKYVRFRQHLRNEMAHYAQDCWDAEMCSSYGWIECIGIADRACFDLSHHSERTNVELQAYLTYDEPKNVTKVVRQFDKKILGKTFRREAKLVTDHVEGMSDAAALELHSKLQSDGAQKLTTADGFEFTLEPKMLTVETVEEKIFGEAYYPHVIEPSFGIGRIIYCLLEHNYWVRPGDDEQRAVLSLSPYIAPYKVAILQLSSSNTGQFQPVLDAVATECARLGISHKVDTSTTTIGRRYSRNDELGIPFSLTVDFDSLKDASVTLRNRDTCVQVRGPWQQIVVAINDVCNGRRTWDEVRKEFPEHEQSASELVGKVDSMKV